MYQIAIALLTVTILGSLASAQTFESFADQRRPIQGSQPDPWMSMNIAKGFTDPAFTADYDFRGIVALSNCSGSLIRLEGNRMSDQALILTNGHCLGGRFLKPGQVVVGKSSRRSFRLLNQAGRTAGRVKATEIVYATMTNTDMAIYKLRETFQEIKDRHGIDPLLLSTKRSRLNTPIEIISGYWKRGYSCAIEKFVHILKEANWTMRDSIRYSRPGCETIGGTSGSPIVEAGTRTVIGVNNTGSERGLDCKMNNPCEVEKDGSRKSHKGFSYGQQTWWLYTCLESDLSLNLDKAGCLLPK